jgi:hypothetical protein
MPELDRGSIISAGIRDDMEPCLRQWLNWLRPDDTAVLCGTPSDGLAIAVSVASASESVDIALCNSCHVQLIGEWEAVFSVIVTS